MTGVIWPAAVLVVWALCALSASMFAITPDELRLERILLSPGWQAWFGCDDLGRSVGERLVAGAQTSFLVGVGVVTASAGVGTAVGMLGAYFGGVYDRILLRVLDVFLAFPGILLAIALAAVLGPGIGNVVMALTIVGWVGYARLARAQTLSLRSREHVQAARALGVRQRQLVLRHILPLLAAPLIVEATFGVASVVVAEAGLSFLGLGVQPPQASWGSMIRDGARYLLVAPHMVFVPGTALMLVVLSVNLLGDRIRDYLDVRLRTAQALGAG